MRFLIAILLCAFSLSCHYAYAQDVMVTIDGEIKDVYNVEISSSSIFFKSSDSEDAPIERIDKSQVFVIKRKDGTKYALKDNNSESGQETLLKQETAQKTNTPEEIVGGELSEEALQQNRELIERINSLMPEYIGKSEKDANRLFCNMGVTENSCLANDDIEMSFEIKRILDTGEYDELTGPPIKGFTYPYDNPILLVTIKNRSANTIYIDLGNTFIIRNENAMAYYIPSATSTSTTSTTGASVNVGAVTSALGIGGAVGNLARGVNVGGGSSSSAVNVTYSQRVVAVPPMSLKVLDAQRLFEEEGKYCDGLYIRKQVRRNYPHLLPEFIFRTNKEKDMEPYQCGETHYFTEEDSPVKFTTYISYSFSENCVDVKKVSACLFLKQIIGLYCGQNFRFYTRGLGSYFSNFEDCIYFIGHIEDYYGTDKFPRP